MKVGTVQHHIFLSYSRKNSAIMHRVKMILQRVGFSVWTDEGIEPGSTSWKMEIEKAIQGTGCFLCICSPDSKNSRWVNTELQRAEWHSKPIFLILAEGDPINSVPFGYETHQLVDIRSNFKDEMIKLLTTLRTRFGKTSTAEIPAAAVPEAPVLLSPLEKVKEVLPAPFGWCTIPAGEVALEEGGYIHSSNKIQTIPAFHIAKYPITNAQFALFVEADGYNQEKWWTKDGWRQRRNDNWMRPRFWHDPKWNQENHPIVGISWYEAVAFCQWLSEQIGGEITLPTDHQWQRAAQGDDGRTYPWGELFDTYRCNTSKDTISSTTAVTAYEGTGDSPYGVVDMAGNVWECCLTEFESGRNDTDGSAWRILRGGSWNNTRRDARTTSRFSIDPKDWFNDIGFRICFSD